ncbi:transferrin-binding protein-like solute binding protein [Ursidibacter sp. B-7004-1]
MHKKYTIAAILVAALTACSSSGNGHSNSNPNGSRINSSQQTNQQGSSQQGSSQQGSSQQESNQQESNQLTFFGGSYYNNEGQGDSHKLIPQSNTHALIVDGKEIMLDNANVDWKGRESLKYSKFGAYIDKNKVDRDGDFANYAFSYGQITPKDKLPKGMAEYIGKGIYASEETDYVSTTASFKVNFDEQTLNGKLESQEKNVALFIPPIKIEGSSFKFSERKDENNNFTIYGHFYGPNAEELGGTIDSEKDGVGILATFGATKQ